MKKFRGHRSRHTRRGTAVRFGILVAVLIVLLAGGYSVGHWLEERSYRQERQQMSENFGLLPTKTYEGKTYLRRPEVTTLLLMGVDQHLDEEHAGYREGGQADFLLLLALDHKNRTISQLQIDRDAMTDVTVVDILGKPSGTRFMQLCLAHAYGRNDEERCKNVVSSVQKLLNDETIELYLSVKLDGIAVLNRALGGIRVTLPEDYSSLDPNMVKGATLTLTDDQAEKLVRARRTIGDGTNAARMLRQRSFLTAAAAQLRAKLASDSEFAGSFFDTLEAISSYTNIQRGRMINEANRAYDYDIQPAEQLAGEYKLGSDGFMEFHADKDAVSAWLIKTLYEPKN